MTAMEASVRIPNTGKARLNRAVCGIPSGAVKPSRSTQGSPLKSDFVQPGNARVSAQVMRPVGRRLRSLPKNPLTAGAGGPTLRT